MNYISEGSAVYYVPMVADCALRLPWHEFDSGDVFTMHNEAEKTHEYEFPVLNLEDKVIFEGASIILDFTKGWVWKAWTSTWACI